MNTTAIILKTDSRGRVHLPKEKRDELLAEFTRSGLPATKFAALTGVNYQTFATWVQQYKKRHSPAQPTTHALPLRFAEVEPVAAAASSARLRVVLPGGACIELHENSQLPLLVALLKSLA
jgi:transposase-like protein